MNPHDETVRYARSGGIRAARVEFSNRRLKKRLVASGHRHIVHRNDKPALGLLFCSRLCPNETARRYSHAPVMKIVCPHCRHAFDEPYYKLGMPVRCSKCQTWFPLNREHVTELGDTGHEITCDDFRQLLRGSMSAEDVETYVTVPVQRHSALHPLCAVRDADSGWTFCSPDRKEWFDPGVLHLVIQQFDSPQQRIYQYAMSKWR